MRNATGPLTRQYNVVAVLVVSRLIPPTAHSIMLLIGAVA
ncbi:hypothetical protein MNBD_GAMMA18-1370 [hydrothermal vent metagenome]|uniref:Uncharacterized protein n=1 Tax=hydrothermal vent metagenome TaxID=652676 RepID=A0A3B0ZKR9_9ZZZZ